MRTLGTPDFEASYRPVFFRVIPLRHAGKQPSAAPQSINIPQLCELRGIGHRREMASGESRLEDSHAAQGRYEQMLASSATAAICAGPDNLIVSWNIAAEQLLGYSA